MTRLLLEPVYWNWWLLGLALILLEMLIPGVFLLWIGLAALGTGLAVMLLPGLSGQWQWLLFTGLTVASLAVGWSYFRRHPPVSANPLLNRRGQQYVGRVFTLNEPIVNGRGKLRVDDTVWKVAGADCRAGVQVRVTGVDGVMLQVEEDRQLSGGCRC